MRQSLLALLVFPPVFVGSFASPAAAVGVTIKVFQPGSLDATLHPPISSGVYDRLALDGVGDWDSSIATPTSLPATGSVPATYGETSSITGYDLSDSSFNFSFDHVRGAASETQAASQVDIYFSVDAEVGYAFSGSYGAVDPAGRDTALFVDLWDEALGATLFSNFQSSDHTPNASFLVGLQEGDSHRELEGSITGTLLPGHLYSLTLGTSIADYFNDGPAATASGTVSLQFVPIPEPGTALLVTAGMLGLAAAHGRRASLSRSH